MFNHRTNLEAHCLAVGAAATPVVGMGLDDVKWLISMLVSLIGSGVALYIMWANTRLQAEAAKREQDVERRRNAARHVRVGYKPADPRADLDFLDH